MPSLIWHFSLGYPKFIELRMYLSVTLVNMSAISNRRNDLNLPHILSKPLA